jgi:hypothetical protein
MKHERRRLHWIQLAKLRNARAFKSAVRRTETRRKMSTLQRFFRPALSS